LLFSWRGSTWKFGIKETRKGLPHVMDNVIALLEVEEVD